MSSSIRIRSLLLVAAAALLSSCDNPAGSGGDPGTPARLDVVSGDLQTGTVDTELPQALVVRVVDDKGKAVSGQVINFRVTAGGGSVFAGAAVTNADGEARERWTLGTVAGDTQRVEARAVDASTGQALVFATFRAIGRGGAPVSITPMGESALTGTAGLSLADSLAVKVLDRFGNGVQGATVVWTVRRGGGTVSPSPSTTDAQGLARTQWTLGTFVDSTQVVDASAAVGMTTSFVASTGVPSGAQLAVRAGGGQTATVGTQLPQPVKVALLLPDGRPVVGAVIAWSLGSGGGSVNPTTSITDANGEATAQWTLPTVAGTASLWAETPGVMGVSIAATATAGPAVSLTRVSGNGQVSTPGSPLADSLVVRAEDSHGNGVPGIAITWTTSSGTVSPASMTTRADGTARTQWTPGGSLGASATATAAGLTPVSFTTQSAGNISIAFGKPGDQPITTENLEVVVGVQSTYAVTSVTAVVGSRSAELVRAAGSSTWSGNVSLAGMGFGTYTVTVTATDATGGQAQASRTFAVDLPPMVEFRMPVFGATVPAGQPVRVVAVCRDDNPAGCASMSVTRSSTTVASGKDSVDFMLPAGSSGDRVDLSVQGTDSRGTSRYASGGYLVESGPRLQTFRELPGPVGDFDGARVLYVTGASPSIAHIRTLATGSEQSMELPFVSFGTLLTPRGLLQVRGPAIPQATLFELRDGAVVELGPFALYEQNRGYYPYPLLVEGKWAAWLSPNGLMRRDLDAGTNTVIHAAGSALYDLAENGDVVFRRNATNDVARYRDGTVTQVVPQASGPKTDGVNVVAVVDGVVAVVRPTGTEPLAMGTATLPVSLDFDVVDGWVAYTRRTSSTTGTVWLRSPAGVDYQASEVFDHARLRALGPNGQVVIEASGRLWLYTPGAAPVDIASTLGRPLWRDGELYMLVGNTIFRVQR